MRVQLQCPNPECRASFSFPGGSGISHCPQCGTRLQADDHAATPPPRVEERPAARLEDGSTLGRYVIMWRLGRGGMGAVYLAHDTQLDRRVALKVPGEGADDAEYIKRFHREARAAANLHHPNICPVFDVGQVDGVHYLTMAYIEGKTLAEVIKAGPSAPLWAARVVHKLARALQAAHEAGVIHRDLKPSNIMLTARQEPIVMDFGLARRLDSDDSRLTRTGVSMGTPAYMPPEQVEGDVAAMGPASDVYSLGVVLYELLAGRLPFEGPSSRIYAQILHAEPPPPSAHIPGLDPALDAICRRAMAKAPADRFHTMTAFARSLEGYALRAAGRVATPADRATPADPAATVDPPAAPAGRAADTEPPTTAPPARESDRPPRRGAASARPQSPPAPTSAPAAPPPARAPAPQSAPGRESFRGMNWSALRPATREAPDAAAPAGGAEPDRASFPRRNWSAVRPDAQGTPDATKPAGGTALGVLNEVFGLLGLCCAPLLLVAGDSTAEIVALRTSAFLYLGMSLVLFASGIGLVRKKAWGTRLSTIYCSTIVIYKFLVFPALILVLSLAYRGTLKHFWGLVLLDTIFFFPQLYAVPLFLRVIGPRIARLFARGAKV